VTSPSRTPIFDGHNDVLLRLYRRSGGDPATAFLQGEEAGQLDLAKARKGGFAGGLFAIFVPPARRKTANDTQNGLTAADAPAVDIAEAARLFGQFDDITVVTVEFSGSTTTPAAAQA